MDGLTDDSPWLALVYVADYIDRLSQHVYLLFGSFLFVCIFYVNFGTRLDLLLIPISAIWYNFSALASWIAQAEITKMALPAAITVAAVLVGLQPFIPIVARRDAEWNGPGKPYLISAKTSHARMFPQKHSFSYSYLVVGVPVGYKGNVKGILSIDEPQGLVASVSALSARFAVNAVDYLLRGSHVAGLRGKLDDYLKSQDVEPAEYPHAYLVTAPRFLGYHFNPVSFWYLYSPDKELAAIVLEVNNTFGERRPYFVKRDFVEEANRLSSADAVPNGHSAPRVKNTWQKDFHVSPFNSRKGSYSLLASDPLGPGMQGFRGIDVTINLVSSKGRPKLVARLFSDGEAMDPATMGFFQRVKFLVTWSWVGFVTFPRIVKEAAALFFKRKLHVWYRPEPLKDSLGRLADTTEADLEKVFRDYLQHVTESSPNPVSVRYISSGIVNAAPERFTSAAASIDGSDSTEEVEIKILTPVFYARFVQYAHDFEAIFSELAESSTLWVDRPDVLPKLFFKKPSPPLQASSVVDFLYFSTIKRLRRRPGRIQRPLTSAEKTNTSPSVTTVDIRGFRMSPMDAFVLGQEDAKLKSTYRSSVLRLLIADRLFLGSIELLSGTEVALRIGVSWALASMLTNASWSS